MNKNMAMVVKYYRISIGIMAAEYYKPYGIRSLALIMITPIIDKRPSRAKTHSFTHKATGTYQFARCLLNNKSHKWPQGDQFSGIPLSARAG